MPSPRPRLFEKAGAPSAITVASTARTIWTCGDPAHRWLREQRVAGVGALGG